MKTIELSADDLPVIELCEQCFGGKSHTLLKDLYNFPVEEDRKNLRMEMEEGIRVGISPFALSDFRIQTDTGAFCFIKPSVRIKEDILEIRLTDVTEYYEQISGHNQLINRYKQLMLTLNEAVWDWNIGEGTIYYSDRWYTMLGYLPGEIEPTFDLWKESLHPEDLDRAVRALDEHISGKTDLYECLYRLRRKDGTWIWVNDRGIRQTGSDGRVRGMIGSHRDVTGEKDIREHLEKMIITDELTGLFNRRHYDAQISDEMLRARRYGSRLSILMIDIDLFKQINDTYGHRSGDIALQTLAGVIKSRIRNTDSAYRLGGEEFMVIAPETDEEQVLIAAERLRKAVSDIVIETEYGSFSFTISLGVTTFNREDTYHTLNERADIALYKSKDAGRNRVTAG